MTVKNQFDNSLKESLRPRLMEYVSLVTRRDKKAGKDMFVCPLCGSGSHGKKDSDGAFHVTGNEWYCHSCKKGGGIFELYACINKLDKRKDFPEILDGLARELGEISDAPPAAKEPDQIQAPAVKPGRAEDIEKYASAIPGSLGEEYLHWRGFSDEVISHFHLGYNKEKTRIVIPYPGIDFYTERAVTANAKKKYLYPAGESVPAFVIKEADSDFYYITEGQLDAISLYQAGARNIIATGGGSYKLLERIEIRGAVIVADRDSERGKDNLTPGERTAQNYQEVLKGKGAACITVYPPEGFKDSNDVLSSDPVTLADLIRGWHDQLIRSLPAQAERQEISLLTNGNGNPRQIVRNIVTVLSLDERFSGKIRYNEFDRQIYLVGSVPWETEENYRAWSSMDDSALFELVQAEYGLNNRDNYRDALKVVAKRDSFHPVIEQLESFQYRGKGYIRKLLPYFLGCEDSDYNFEVMKLFMLGAVSRVYQPGCKFDYCPIFTGPQGLGKSTFFRMLAIDDDWFNDSLNDMDSEKTTQYLTGSWIIELGELKAFAKTGGGIDSVKRFLTATQDKYRVPYEKRADIFLRQCVFAGTTNKHDFLQDITGNRRFLVVKCGEHDPEGDLFDESNRELFEAAWAEAVQIYKEEDPKLLLPSYCSAEAEALQNEAMADDGIRGLIEEFVADKEQTCVREIWIGALNHSNDSRPKPWESSEIASILKSLGFEDIGPRKFVYTVKHWDSLAQKYTIIAEIPFGSQKIYRRKLPLSKE